MAMRFVATAIIVLRSFCSITAVQAEQSNSCKQCREQQQACAKNYSAKTCKTEYDICMKGCQNKYPDLRPDHGRGSFQGSLRLAISRSCLWISHQRHQSD